MKNIKHYLPFFISFMLYYAVASDGIIHSLHLSQNHSSHIEECNALLRFGNSFTITRDASMDYCSASFPKTVSWKQNADCCSWDGVTCDKVTDNVIILDLSCSWLQGTLDSDSVLFSLFNLKELNLAGNNFNGSSIPSRLGTFSEMTHLDLSHSHFSGSLPQEISHAIWNSPLENFYASGNNFSKEIPSSVCHVTSLRNMDLSNNRLTGKIPRCFGNLGNLFNLDLSNNSLEGPLPQSLGNCTALRRLNVSYNGIYDTFPVWLSETNLQYIDFQSNHFYGVIQSSLPPQLLYLSLSQNNLEGPLPIPPPTIIYYIVSKNNFSGEIPHQICSSTRLVIINLSSNSLAGSIPRCFIDLTTSLSVLDLRTNKLVGQVPDIFVPGNNLTTIQLSQNQLGGSLLSSSLAHCTRLEVLDLSENEFEGPFPDWLESLLNLKVVVLRSKKFRGPVECFKRSSRSFPNLHILDLSDNSFSGKLPDTCLAKLEAIKINVQRIRLRYMGKKNGYYQDSITVTIKGSKIELVKILTFCTMIDFSRNNFKGEIPALIGDLKALKGLNFSYNMLTGKIPNSMGNLSNLDWLDLSSNKIHGEIPTSLAILSSLGYLNLSNNQLEGKIPQSTQFDTFINAFDGNPKLCGHPLPKTCLADTQHPSTPLGLGEKENESGPRIVWRAVLIGYGFGLVLGISLCHIMLETGRPTWLQRMFKRIIFDITKKKNKPPPKKSLKKENLRRKR